jgi:flagellar basal body P-ring formation protein FlgA
MQIMLFVAAPAAAVAEAEMQAVIAERTIRPGDVISSADVRLGPSDSEGALSARAAAVGMVARRLLVAGRPVMQGDVGPPALIRRNAHVALVFQRGTLAIRAEGRALSDGAEGERVRVMNLASRQTVTGTVLADGSVAVGARE